MKGEIIPDQPSKLQKKLQFCNSKISQLKNSEIPEHCPKMIGKTLICVGTKGENVEICLKNFQPDIYDVYTSYAIKSSEMFQLQKSTQRISKNLYGFFIYYYFFLEKCLRYWNISKNIKVRISNSFWVCRSIFVHFGFNLFLLRHEIDSQQKKLINHWGIVDKDLRKE